MEDSPDHGRQGRNEGNSRIECKSYAEAIAKHHARVYQQLEKFS